jgi:hypothetical protein
MKIRWHWGFGLAAVYTAFAAGTTGVALFAMRQQVDLVSADYYARSLDHDAHLAAIERTLALGDGVRVGLVGRTLDLSWPAERARPIAGTVTLYRPSSAAADRTIGITPDAAGTMRVPLADLPAGRWTVQLAWQAAGLTYYLEREVVVR